MDADGRFTLGSDEFVALIGPTIADALGASWSDGAARWASIPTGQVARAVASRDTWSGITVDFPVEGTGERLAVELSGLPVFDRERNFLGYRGFGICRDVARIAALTELRRNAPQAAGGNTSRRRRAEIRAAARAARVPRRTPGAVGRAAVGERRAVPRDRARRTSSRA